MKRAQEHISPPCEELLPRDLLLEIARASGWVVSGALARLDKHLLRLFTSRDVLREIITTIKQGDSILFRWLLLSLPCSLLGAGDAMATVQPLALKEHADFSPEKSCAFVTGGRVCQRLYRKEWESDIDIFTARDGDDLVSKRRERHQLMLEGEKYDLVQCPYGEETERCIENFDLSLVQQGYHLHTGVVYCTPLALYSAMWQEIVAIPSASLIQYHAGPHRPWVVANVWHYIDRHRHDHQPEEYHVCDLCEDDESNGALPFRPWRTRMRNYCARFPGFTVVYCRTPSRMKGTGTPPPDDIAVDGKWSRRYDADFPSIGW